MLAELLDGDHRALQHLGVGGHVQPGFAFSGLAALDRALMFEATRGHGQARTAVASVSPQMMSSDSVSMRRPVSFR